jgi:predicted O-methyltransferase YrrM
MESEEFFGLTIQRSLVNLLFNPWKAISYHLLTSDRMRFFADRIEQDRNWWFRIPGNDSLPLMYQFLTDEEFTIFTEWFEETESKELIGECSVVPVTAIGGFVAASNIDSIVQCGHYSGYSTLLLGFLLRRLAKPRSLFSIDIDPEITRFAQGWVNRAGLSKHVKLVCGDSSDPAFVEESTEYFGKRPGLVFIDSSHQYEHTLKELDLWFEAIVPGGLIFLHDVSDFASQFDATGKGGVCRALSEWRTQHECIMINPVAPDSPRETTAYQDGCGLGIVHKLFGSADRKSNQ